jgi:ribonuclease P protein component
MAAEYDRLQRSDEVRAVLRRGRRRVCDVAVVHVLLRGDAGPGRLTVVASKRVGGAVARNRAKRVLREAARVVGVAQGVDVALVARVGADAVGMHSARVMLEHLYRGPLGTTAASTS